jgi:OOP family OmpA-OmpF porin
MEDNMKITKKLIVWGSFLLFVSVCATLQAADAPLGNPGELVNQLQADLATARANQLDILAPIWFDKAEASFAKAKKAFEKGKELSDISKYLAESRLSLAKAEEMAKIARTILGDTNQARQKAIDAGAEKLGEPYQDAEKQYLKLTKAIEKNNTRYAQDNAAKVQEAFREVEIMAIKADTLQEARAAMAQADKLKLIKVAPQAYSTAGNALNEADAYIGQNPYDTANNRKKAAEATFMARRLLAVVGTTEKLEEMEPEDAALYVETLLVRLSKALEAGDLRDRSVEDQLSVLATTADQMRMDNLSQKELIGSYQNQIAAMEQRIAGLKGLSVQQEAAKERLTAERAFDERFNKVQSFFTPSEAEVYKQGNQLVIRMRGIKFPVGQAILVSENYGLLSKVQKAIQAFDQPNVTIEGHTDSTGSTELNLKLSKERAEAVKAYLVANRTLPSSHITSVGYGPERPLASNSTLEGRAANRRIDVLIRPVGQP